MDHPHWLERLTGSTRLRVLELLLREDQTVQEVAQEIGVTPNAVRGHIAALERDGLVVQSGARRDTGGKPAAIYAVSTAADELFPKAYAFVLERLVGMLEERVGDDVVREVLLEVGRQAAPPATGSAEERVQAAAEVLRSLGGTVEVQRTREGFKIQGFACPLSAVSKNDRRFCGLAEALVRTTTGGKVREVCERHGRPRCAFEIDFPEPSRGG
jgi:predicted ArsR family transcriptional regulator